MSAVQIVGKEYYCTDIFSNSFRFRLPRYQRPYAWTTEEAGELLEDLWAAFRQDEKKETLDKDPYFLGSIVLVKPEDPSDALVIDGQQRLTTLTILLSVLRHLGVDHISGYLRQEGKPHEGLKNEFRLRLREQDAEFFEKFIQNENGIAALPKVNAPSLRNDAQRNIRANALYLCERLKDRRDKLQEFTRFVINKCMMVVVSTVDEYSAYRIFTVLNSRGLDLSHADILKAEIIGAIDNQRQEKYARKWEVIEENLGLDDFKNLFAHIRMIHVRKKLESTILKEIRDHIRPKEHATKFIDDELEPYGDALQTITQCNYKGEAGAERINEHLRWLKQIDNVDWVPTAIVALTRHESKPEWLDPFFQGLERLAAGFLVMRLSVNERLERYAKLLADLEKGNDVLVSGSNLHLTDDDRAKVLQGLNANLYEMTRVRRYVLLRLDHALSGGGAKYDHSTITIEHVLPQTPKDGSQWLKWFPDEKERTGWLHRVANLVLLSRAKNSEAQNFDFEEKKERYFKSAKGISPFVLTTQVLNETEWTLEVLHNRQEQLVGKLQEIWSL
ncbi:MAG: DUF262 domain-containing protein [Nitrospira sp.]|nr:DUF262 domain-containing protein [Nitrospira sp.]